MTNSNESWRGAAPRILSDDDAHFFVWYVLDIATRHGWMNQDDNITDWLEDRLA